MTGTHFSMQFLGDAEVCDLDINGALRPLSRKDVQRFEEYLIATDPQFSDGLSSFEKKAIEGYIVRKVRGDIDAYHNQGSGSEERYDGPPSGS